MKALIDLETVIQKGVVDEAFPSHSTARFFEITAHYKKQAITKLLGEMA